MENLPYWSEKLYDCGFLPCLHIRITLGTIKNPRPQPSQLNQKLLGWGCLQDSILKLPGDSSLFSKWALCHVVITAREGKALPSKNQKIGQCKNFILSLKEKHMTEWVHLNVLTWFDFKPPHLIKAESPIYCSPVLGAWSLGSSGKLQLLYWLCSVCVCEFLFFLFGQATVYVIACSVFQSLF